MMGLQSDLASGFRLEQFGPICHGLLLLVSGRTNDFPGKLPHDSSQRSGKRDLLEAKSKSLSDRDFGGHKRNCQNPGTI